MSNELEGGSYEVIRARLLEHASKISELAQALNTKRREEFGGEELSVQGNERVRTEHNCVPRDVVPVGKFLLMGFNVFMGLKQEKAPVDVFSLHRFERTAEGGFNFDAVAPTEAGAFLEDRRFVRDFSELTRYYKEAKLARVVRTDVRLLVVMQTGAAARDVKVFRFNLDAEGRATYLDMTGDAELPKPVTHDFEWQRLGRDDVVAGRHPHISVFDEVFVETIGGDLTVKVENNTDTGQGIYSDPVVEKDQSIDDAEFYAQRAGSLILLKIKPFREEAFRYLVFNTRTRTVARTDGIGQSCVQLPEDQGVVFPGGYVLQTGEVKVFDQDVSDLTFERAIKSPNGEDVLYVFYGAASGRYLLLTYNLVRKEMASPIEAQGWAMFPDGLLVLSRAAAKEASRVHPMQVWKTPFLAPEVHAALPKRQSALGRIGNADLVRGISDVLTLKRLADSETPTRRMWEDLVSQSQRVLDTYFWLGEPNIGLVEPVRALKSSAELIIDEFEKVLTLKKRASEVMTEAETAMQQLLARTLPSILHSTTEFMDALTSIRTQRGRLISLKEVRYVDAARLSALEAQCVEQFGAVSGACVEFLLKPEAFVPVKGDIEQCGTRSDAATRMVDLEPVVKRLEEVGQGLDLIGEAIGGLKAGDADQKARILESLSEVYATLNRVRGGALSRRKELLGKERRAEFGAQFKLLGQGIESALSLADSPERCDEQLARLSVQVEELEGRFSELDEFASQLAERRESLFEAFESKKRALVDERQRRAQNLFGAAERILQGVQRRAKSFTTEDELNAFFAGDALMEKLRDLAQQLIDLKDSVKADEVDSKLRTARQDALRALRDKKDLFEAGGDNVIKFGESRFNVNTQPIELTVLPKDGGLCLHVTGTDFMQPLVDPELERSKHLAERTLPSESNEVYRGETLAAQVLFAAEEGRAGLSLAELKLAANATDGLLATMRAFAAERYDEGYERGLHDADAALILAEVLRVYDGAGLLRYAASARAAAVIYWSSVTDESERLVLHRRAMSLGRLRDALAPPAATMVLADDVAARMKTRLTHERFSFSDADLSLAARYLLEELAQPDPHFVVSRDAVALRDALMLKLSEGTLRAQFDADLKALEKHLGERVSLVRAWLEGLIARGGEGVKAAAHALEEAAVLIAVDERLVPRVESSALLSAEVKGLLGSHSRITDRVLKLRIDEFTARLSRFVREEMPAFHAFRGKLRELTEVQRKKLKLDELKPKVLSSFVRNQLIDQVYLPLIGKNLAKQLGAAGETKRTDRMGMLLLISPPGYGKTTLMEYVASRLGLVFVKVNGPALGHAVTSVDPNEAPNATSRQEVERINFAFELGNNVMLYLDDIQHTNAELLQKFISLCDGQRKVEGVWNGVSRTYDLRGKKFCVVMAGNPYTETGETFRIPDMLANRADTYNLGDILDGRQDTFAKSYLENALTSNPVLAPLASRPNGDVHRMIKLASGEEVPSSEFEYSYSGVELSEMTAIFKRLLRVQASLLKVNQQYIASAAQDDRFRTEPPFKLQGSYRNMNKLAEKVVAGMTDEEVDRLVDAHYAQEAQTLTTAAEQNLLKLAELTGRQTPDQRARWEELKRGYKRVQVMGGSDADPVVRVTGSISSLGNQLEAITGAVERAASKPAPQFDGVATQLQALRTTLEKGSGVGAHVESLRDALVAAFKTRPAEAPAVVQAQPDQRALTEAVLSVAKVVAEAAKRSASTDPKLLAALSEVVEALRAQPAPSAPAGSAIPPEVLEKLLAARPAGRTISNESARRLSVLADTLALLERTARGSLQKGEDSQMKAIEVWTTVKEALELLDAVEV